jgi:hypothetical protein
MLIKIKCALFKHFSTTFDSILVSDIFAFYEVSDILTFDEVSATATRYFDEVSATATR